MRMSNNKGFGLSEMIIVIGVITILIVMAFPQAQEFIRSKKLKEEEDFMLELVRALDAYAQEHDVLPASQIVADPDAWAEELRASTNMSVDQMANTVWRSGIRYYRNYDLDNMRYRDVDLSVSYAFVYSPGEDGCFDGPPQVCDEAGIRAAVDSLVTGATDQELADSYDELDVSDVSANGGDDQLVKYTNKDIKLKRLAVTQARLEKIADALQRFALSYRNDAIANFAFADVANPTSAEIITEINIGRAVYVPPSQGSLSAVHNAAVGMVTTSNMLATTDPSTVNNAGGSAVNHGNRRLDMIGLMKILGLPESHCCHPLEHYDDGTGEEFEMPFYYYSTPRARLGGSCGPANALGANGLFPVILPARITVTEDTCGQN